MNPLDRWVSPEGAAWIGHWRRLNQTLHFKATFFKFRDKSVHLLLHLSEHSVFLIPVRVIFMRQNIDLLAHPAYRTLQVLVVAPIQGDAGFVQRLSLQAKFLNLIYLVLDIGRSRFQRLFKLGQQDLNFLLKTHVFF